MKGSGEVFQTLQHFREWSGSLSRTALACAAFLAPFTAKADIVAPTVTIHNPLEADSFEAGATIPLVAEVDNSGGATVTGVEFYDNGTLIGQAQLSAIGYWIFPDFSELAVMGNGLEGMVDYTPPGAYDSGEQMYTIFGSFLAQNSFQGTFSHWDVALADYVYGNAGIQFSLGTDGTLDASISGDAPLGTRNLAGGVNQHFPKFTLAWSGAAVGPHALTARAYYGTGSHVTSAPVNISVTGAATTRVISLGGNLAFGKVKVGTSANATLTIGNTGNSPLVVTSISYPAGFTGNWPGGTIAAGNSQDVTVTFSPSAAQAYSGTITVNSDATSGTNTIAPSGQGTQSPFEAWQAAEFTTDDVATGLTTPTADFDRDGLPNFLEYAFGKNPKAANTSGIAPNLSGNKMQISFPCLAGRSDITYTVQSSSNLISWDDIAESVGGTATVPKNSSGCAITDPGTGLRTVTVTEAAAFTGKRFLRVKITSP